MIMNASGHITMFDMFVCSKFILYDDIRYIQMVVVELSKNLPRKDFHTLLRALLDDKGPVVKYQNPCAWRGY